MRHVVLLRGINLGRTNRIAMPALRAALSDAGFADVQTYVQSGNVVVDSDRGADGLDDELHALLLARFDLDVAVVVRSAEDLAAVVAADPFGAVATDPKRYQVTFCSAAPEPEIVARLAAAAVGEERIVALGRELYAWHPDGVARSKLWAALARKGLGVVATSRNWRTVLTLLEMTRA